ncbi:unnamed protein product, partial [Sphacelaria rigidula]
APPATCWSGGNKRQGPSPFSTCSSAHVGPSLLISPTVAAAGLPNVTSASTSCPARYLTATAAAVLPLTLSCLSPRTDERCMTCSPISTAVPVAARSVPTAVLSQF